MPVWHMLLEVHLIRMLIVAISAVIFLGLTLFLLTIGAT